MIVDGKVSFTVNNLSYSANTGYSAVLLQTQRIDAVNAQSVIIFVLDSFITMKIKSNIVKL